MSESIEIVNNQDIIPYIEELVGNIIESLDDMDITTETTELSIQQCITIISVISKGMSEIKGLVEYFKNMNPDEKTSAAFNITTEVLAHPDINKKLSPQVNNQIKAFANNKELLNTISSLLNWSSSKILNSFDNNSDGIITIKEIEDDFVDLMTGRYSTESEGFPCYREGGCCKGSVKFIRVVGNIWAKFFIKIMCCHCGENSIELKRT